MGRALAVVYRNLARLHGAGVGWSAAFDSAVGPRDARFARAREAVARGEELSRAMVGAIPALDLAGVRAAETSGRLEAVLDALADRHEEDERYDREERTSLLYPLFLTYLVAVLAPLPDLLAGRGAAAIGWSLLVLAPAHVYLAVRYAARRAVAADPMRPAPSWAHLVRTRAALEASDARALLALSWLHEAGVPPAEAATLAAAAGGHGRAAGDLRDAAAAAARGEPLARALSRLPSDVRSTLDVGEQTGTLADAARRAGERLAESARTRRARTLALLKPLSVVVLGLLVGVRVIAFYAAMFRGLGR